MPKGEPSLRSVHDRWGVKRRSFVPQIIPVSRANFLRRRNFRLARNRFRFACLYRTCPCFSEHKRVCVRIHRVGIQHTAHVTHDIYTTRESYGKGSYTVMTNAGVSVSSVCRHHRNLTAHCLSSRFPPLPRTTRARRPPSINTNKYIYTFF